MELTVYEQILEQFKKSSKVLIVLPSGFNLDQFSAGLALKGVLAKLQKDTDLVSSGVVDEKYTFLPGSDSIKSSLSSAKSLVIRLNTAQKKLQEISYDTAENEVSIYLKGAEESFAPEDITFVKEKSPYDLVIILGASTLNSLGILLEQNSSVFYELPKINIDNKAENELYGAINWVDLAATSVSEMIFGLVEKSENLVVDDAIATCLLSGIISETDSFQHVKTTPRSFLTASKLVELGAKQQEVIQALYKTKPLNFLRLWGRALAKLKGEGAGIYMHAVLNWQDFEKASATPDFMPKIVTDVLGNISDKKILGVISENPEGGSRLSLALHKLFSENKFKEEFGQPVLERDLSPLSFKFYEFILPDTALSETETKFIKIADTF